MGLSNGQDIWFNTHIRPSQRQGYISDVLFPIRRAFSGNNLNIPLVYVSVYP